MPPILHLVRHAQGFHNIPPESLHAAIRDAALTAQGEAQCRAFGKAFPADASKRIKLICASPLTRTLRSALLAFPEHDNGMWGHGKGRIMALPDVQEAREEMSNVGLPLDILRERFEEGDVNWSEVEKHAYWWKKVGIYGMRREELDERAVRFRKWMRDRPEEEVLVFGHGVFWHYVTENIDESGNQTGPYWLNLMWRTFEFVEGDEDARLVETEESKARTEQAVRDVQGPALKN